MNYPSLREIRAFLAVVRARNFRRAADDLCVSRPALSQAIAKLEETVGGRLFDRTTRTVELSPLGRSLLPGAERIEAEVHRTFRDLRDLTALVRGEVAMGCLASLTVRLLPPVVARFRAAHPGISIAVRDDTAPGLARRLRAGEIEFAVTTLPRPDTGLAFRPLAKDPFRLLCPAGHPLSRRRGARWADLAGHVVIGFDRDTSNRAVMDRALAAAGVDVTFAMELTQLGTVVGMVQAGAGVAALPATACPDDAATVSLPLTTPRVVREIGIATLPGRSLTSAAAHMATAVEEAFARPSP